MQVAPESFLRTTSGEPIYELCIGSFPRGYFRVHSFTGRERLSGALRFDIDLTVPFGRSDDVEERALARQALFVMRVGARPRLVRGVIDRVRVIARDASGDRLGLRVRLISGLGLVRQRVRSQIFQDQTVPDIVDSVLRDAGIEREWRLETTFPVRP